MEETQKLKQAVREYKGGKTDAFTPLYEESCKYVFTCINKVMSGNDNAHDIVNDIMQDTYVEISKSISQLENEDRFLQWAGIIATRKCYAYLKKNKKYVLMNEEDSTFDNLSDSESIIPEEIMQNKEKQRLVREIIDNQLTEMQKLCVIAYYYNEQKQSEIAKEFDIPENTVKTNLSRAKAKIKAGVTDLEKKDGIKLYSVAPFLLLLFAEDIQAAVVPAQITKNVLGAMSASAGAKGIVGKIASASIKTKITGGIIGLGVAGAVVGTALSHKNTIPEDAGYFQGHYYYVQELEEDITWDEAEKYFESLGGHLLIINSQEENDYAFQYMNESGYTSAYFGLTDEKNDGEWKWVTGEDVTYTNWASGEPNSESSSENYAMFYYKFTDGKWNDGGITTVGNRNTYLCEWDKK